jgi:hypothetical protein
MQATSNIGSADITARPVDPKTGQPIPDGQSRIEQFMNPYTTQVVDALGALGQRNIQQFLAPQATASAVGTGQFGSKRGAEVLGQAINTGLMNTQAAQSQALQSGYTEALRAAQADQAQKLGAASQFGNLATAGQAANLADINALATMGSQQQTINQNQQLYSIDSCKSWRTSTCVVITCQLQLPILIQARSPVPTQLHHCNRLQDLGSIIGGVSNTNFGNAIGKGITGLWNDYRLDSKVGMPSDITQLEWES